MIVLEIDSGLGNQMFMYAACRHLAMKHHAELYLDVDVACTDGYGIGQNFQLDKFNITANYANREILRQFDADEKFLSIYEKIRGGLRKSQLIRLVASQLRKSGLNVSKVFPVGVKNENKIYEEPEDDWQFKSEFLSLPDNMYIKGYFPSFKYFEPIKDIILREFTLKNELSEKSKLAEKEILTSNSISIHFRRGDVVSKPRYRSWYDGVVTDEYYRNAIAYFSNAFEDVHFFVFSNEIEWVKANFVIPGKVTYVDHNRPATGYEDLYLMSRCKHNVTTGCSSFSWWGAYLNSNSDKVIIRTERMTSHDHMNCVNDFFPGDWVTVKS